MSVFYWLECPQPHQCVHIVTMTGSAPTGNMAHWVVIQLFTIAHNIIGDSVITNDTDEQSLEWDLGNCIELFERMTQKIVTEQTLKVVQDALNNSSEDFEGTTTDWLKNYTYSGREDANLS